MTISEGSKAQPTLREPAYVSRRLGVEGRLRCIDAYRCNPRHDNNSFETSAMSLWSARLAGKR